MFSILRTSLLVASLSAVFVMAQPPADEPGPAEELEPAESPAGETPATESPATALQPTTSPVQAPQNPLQAEIYRELLREIDRPEIWDQKPGQTTAGAPHRSDTPLIPEGTTWMQRAGRLIMTGSKSVFEFQGGPPVPGAAAEMEFNRNAWLEAMEREAERGVRQFIVSVEVTQYRGKNYLNLLKYRRQLSHGNLAP